MIKKLRGIAPQSTADGAYAPSKLSLKLAASPDAAHAFGQLATQKMVESLNAPGRS
ncbi:MAG: hypothetical protein RIC19_09140 [Phaeodactylibacter sp.]|uniref:hypothetical protein n=1 Tax=Phaeodactylibacter sp. TaxID=1940289 RepID=UPI0032ECC587